jgi:DNA-binding NarL/FixJ family response regulator
MSKEPTALSSRPAVVIADDYALMVLGLRVQLQATCNVIATFADGQDLIEQISPLRPDIIVLSISLPGLNGLDVARYLHEILPATKIILMATQDNREHLQMALRAGANAYLLKRSPANELDEAVRHVMRDEIYFSPSIPPGVIADLNPAGALAAVAAGSGRLTARQRQVLQLLIEGGSSKQIAWTLGISVKTVDFHRARLMERLGAHSTPQLVRLAIEQQLISKTVPAPRPAVMTARKS